MNTNNKDFDCYVENGLTPKGIIANDAFIEAFFRKALLENADKLKEESLEDMIFQPLYDKQKEFFAERERRIEYALRFLILQPIKGEITKSKMKWRGLYYKAIASNTRVEDGKIILTTYYPLICGKESKSGKRPEFIVSLDFEQIPYWNELYLEWRWKTYGIPKNYKLYESK